MREHYEDAARKGDLSAIDKLKEYLNREQEMLIQLKAAGGIEADKQLKKVEAERQRLSEYYLKMTADVPF